MKTIVGVIFLVFVIIIGMSAIDKERFLFYNSLDIEQTSSNNSYEYEDENVYTVIITGAVKSQGTYEIEEGGFLEEIINQAGGLTDKADHSCFDYYLQIYENIEIYIAPLNDEKKISINNSSLDDLMTLTGIGKVIGNRIIEYRDNNGQFKYLEELMNIDGIGKSIFLKIRDKICL